MATVRQGVFNELRNHAHSGLTDVEIAIITKLQPASVRRARAELQRNGQVRPAGERRNNTGLMATVWKLTG